MQHKNNNKIISKPFDGIKRFSKVSESIDTLPNPIPNTWFASVLRSSTLKLVGVVAFGVVLSTSLSNVGSTASYFNDMEQTVGNYLKADPLGFKVQIDGLNTAQVDLVSGETLLVPVMIPNSDSEPIQYTVTSKITGGDTDLCKEINILGTYPFPYDGKIASLQTATTTQAGSWALNFSLLNPDSFSNKSCTIDLVYSGWNADAPYGKGYSDTQTFSITFFVPNIVVAPLIAPMQTIVAEEEVASTTPPAVTEVVTEETVVSETPVVTETLQVPEPVVEPKVEEVVPVVTEQVVEIPIVPTGETIPEVPASTSESI